MRNHLDLLVWRKTRDLAVTVYRLTASFPREERFTLVPQLRRAAVSVMSNVAEGAARRSDREFARFLDIALGSASELDAQLDLSAILGFIDEVTARRAVEDLVEVKKMLAGLLASVLRRAGTTRT
jgi:four helix bundle protein